jgi:hypothetical protein
LLASSLLMNLVRLANTRRPNMRKLLILVAGATTLVSLTLPLLQTVGTTIRLTTIDSRETARSWISRNLPPGSRIAVEAYAPYVNPQRFSAQGFNELIDHTPEWYTANAFDYLVFSQGSYGRRYQEPDKYAKQVSQYEDLFHSFSMVKTFTDGGYEVRIYQVKHQ